MINKLLYVDTKVLGKEEVSSGDTQISLGRENRMYFNSGLGPNAETRVEEIVLGNGMQGECEGTNKWNWGHGGDKNLVQWKLPGIYEVILMMTLTNGGYQASTNQLCSQAKLPVAESGCI